jgi:ERF superfamily
MSIVKSESISKLVSALALAKAAFAPVLKLSENPGFKRNGRASKYADLATAIAATEDALLANGLVVSQFPVNEGDRVGALTLLTHSSGEYLGEAFTLPLGQQNAQTGVAAVTYARRTGYLAALGIASEDDDGQTASGRDDNTAPYVDAYTHPASTTELPDFQEAQHAAPRANPAPRTEKPTQTTKPLPKEPQQPPVPDIMPYTDYKGITEVLQETVAAPENVPSKGDAYEAPEADCPPTEAELTEYRAKFKLLGDDLSAKGKLKSSQGLPINRKLLVFLLSITKAADAKTISKSQWENFFSRVDAAKANDAIGLVGITKLVNAANGLEEKK